MNELHEYTEEFFEYIERGSVISAKHFSNFLVPLLGLTSVLDVGCGRGAWVREWHAAGVPITHGADGPYVREQSLLIPRDDFRRIDLSQPFNLPRRYDLVASLEVAEHLPPSCSETFVASLARHSDIVLFSAATPGQGGENHINEKPLTFWQEIFCRHDYNAYDVIRPAFHDEKAVEPWYRYNAVLYASKTISAHLPETVRSTHVPLGRLVEVGDIGWQARKSILRLLPVRTVTALSRWNYRRLNRSHRRKNDTKVGAVEA